MAQLLCLSNDPVWVYWYGGDCWEIAKIKVSSQYLKISILSITWYKLVYLIIFCYKIGDKLETNQF